VKIISVGSLSLARDANGAFGMFPVSLEAVPHGFRPTQYHWKIDEGSSWEQSALGGRVDLDMSVGSRKGLRYDYRFLVVASDEFGNTATARYTLRLEPPTGLLFVRYDDPRSQVGAGAQTESDGATLHRLAYRTVLVEARAEGLLGHVKYAWSPAPVDEAEASQDRDQAVFKMLVSGDPNDIESYEGLVVRVHATDEIGQSVSLQKFVDAVTELEQDEDKTQRP
jgi:hypothetical protein